MRTRSFLLFAVLLLNVFDLFSRAGGGSSGGGGGGGGGYRSYGYGHHHYYYGHSYAHGNGTSDFTWTSAIIIGIVTLVFIGTVIFGFAILMRRSHKNAKSKMEKAQKFDSFWNEERMQDHVREVFPKIQSAWMSRELRDVADLVTMRFVARFQPLLNEYKRKKIINVLDRVQVEKVSIVDVHDDKDNSKDSFAAYIKGSMRDFLAHESGGILGTLDDQDPEGFEDLYVFRRKGDKWMLDHIVNDPSASDFKLKHHLN